MDKTNWLILILASMGGGHAIGFIIAQVLNHFG